MVLLMAVAYGRFNTVSFPTEYTAVHLTASMLLSRITAPINITALFICCFIQALIMLCFWSFLYKKISKLYYLNYYLKDIFYI